MSAYRLSFQSWTGVPPTTTRDTGNYAADRAAALRSDLERIEGLLARADVQGEQRANLERLRGTIRTGLERLTEGAGDFREPKAGDFDRLSEWAAKTATDWTRFQGG